MRNLILALFVVVLAGCSFQPSKPEITHKYDEFVGMEAATVGPFEISRGISWDISRGTQRTGEKAGESVFLLTLLRNGAVDTVGSSGWKYLDNNTMDLIVDGNSHQVGRGDHDGRAQRAGAGGVYVVEQVTYTLDADDLRVLTGGVDVLRGRIGRTEFELNDVQLEALNRFVETEVMPYAAL
ncbi:hypothetical protein [Marinobacter subterrani]|uniref:hypothetical protein n=1 Tax=Marinobacter subterrani TaxID=1658765 RepID=UPI0023558232|nr:hypothetical protein [Marinobacter subterrani]